MVVRWRKRHAGVLGILLGAVVAACHRTPSEPAPVGSGTISEGPAPEAPRELLARGALGRPAETWKRLRSLMGGSALRLPSTLPLTITTLIGASPLSAGLIDDTAPVALAVLDDVGSATLVAGMHLTSGPEFVAALTAGADARFTAELDAEHAVTVLTPMGQHTEELPGRASDGIVVGVAKNRLLLARTRSPLVTAAAYIGRTLGPSLRYEDEGLTLVVGKSALVGPLSALLREGVQGVLAGLEAARVASGREHGRDPDFGDPKVVMAALSKLADAATAVVGSAADVTISAALLRPIPEVSVDIAPEATGPARDLVRELAVGDLSPLLALPQGTEVALLWQRAAPKGEDSGEPSWAAVLGDRLRPGDHRLLASWEADFRRGLGSVAMAGVLSSESRPSLFVVAPEGDVAAARRAALALPSLLQIPAIARPLGAFVGPFRTRSGSREIQGIGAATELRVERTRRPGVGAARESVLAVELLLSARGDRVAAIAGVGEGKTGLAGILNGASAGAIGSEEVVARAVTRAGRSTAAACLVLLRDEAARAGWAALGVGSDRRVLHVELTASEVAVRALLQAGLAP